MPDIAVFGGAFDPITLGHQSCALAISAATQMQVWFMPCYKHRFNKKTAAANDRFEMCRAAAEDLSHLKRQMFWATDYEIKKQHNGSTYELMEMLSAEHPENRYHIVIGMDNANILKEKWKHAEQLLEKYPFLVMTRQGYEPLSDWWKNPPHRLIEIGWQASSTSFRLACTDRDFESARFKVSDSVWDHISTYELYEVPYAGPSKKPEKRT